MLNKSNVHGIIASMTQLIAWSVSLLVSIGSTVRGVYSNISLESPKWKVAGVEAN